MLYRSRSKSAAKCCSCRASFSVWSVWSAWDLGIWRGGGKKEREERSPEKSVCHSYVLKHQQLNYSRLQVQGQ